MISEIKARRRSQQARPNGYAIILVLFFLTLVIISLAAAMPNVVTQGRREREKEMIWRGNQYARGVRLFYQKTHRFPKQLEDLYKPNNGIRFMRQPYKDPQNTVDGSWRLISVGPHGELIGSLKAHRNAFFFGATSTAGFAGALSTPAAAQKDPFSTPSASPGGSAAGAGNTPSSAPANPVNTGDGSALTTTSSGDQSAQNGEPSHVSQAPPTVSAPVDDGPLLGQTMIIGVGSKVNKDSILTYDGARNYLEFEFMWNGLSPGSRNPLP